MSKALLDTLGQELGDFFAPLVEAAGDPDALASLLDTLGSAPGDPAGAPLATVAEAVSGAIEEIQAIAAAPAPAWTDVAALLESARQGVLAVQSLEASGTSATAALAGLGTDLIDLLTGSYVARKSLLLYHLAVLLLLVDAPQDIVATEPVLVNGTIARGPVSLPRFHPDRLAALVRDPVAHLKAGYLTPLETDADANAMADKLFSRVRNLLRAANLLCRYGVTPEERTLLGAGAPYIDHALTVWVADEAAGASADAGLAFMLSPATRGDLGLVIAPFGTVQVSTQVWDWMIQLGLTAEIDALAIGRRGTVIAAGVDTTSVDGRLSVTRPAPESGPAFVFGTPTGTRLEVGGATFVTELVAAHDGFVWSIAAGVSGSTLVVSPGDGDGFLQSVLPRDGLRIPFDLGLTWSNRAGLAFRGGGSLVAALPIGVAVGGLVRVPTLYLALEADAAGGIAAELALAISVTLGPLTAIVDHAGLLATVTFPPSGGNLGIANLETGFASPKGMGLVVDAGVVSGGGYLAFDPARGEYAGALDLDVCGIAVTAFGDLQTRLPAGEAGYSFIALLSAAFSPGIELGFGFTLDGVGGLLGLHRTIDPHAIQTALWNHHLDGLLFPADPVASAPQLRSAVDAYFPAAPGRTLIGPLARLGWGGGLAEGQVALLLELPEPLKLLLIGDVQVTVPPQAPQLELNLSFAGGVDFGTEVAFFDATLHDSQLAGYKISGDLAFRYGWGDDGVFALALGGFNSHFQPPAGFPTLKRLAITISSSVAQIEAHGYLALTSNTLQFGAGVELTAGSGGFNVHGWLGFEALCERDPLAFQFDLSGGVDLRHGTDVLASVHLEGHLWGPTPWRVAGKASLSLLFVEISVDFDETWGSDADALPAPDPVPALLAALADRSSWGEASPPAAQPAVTLVATAPDAHGAVLLDPVAGLRIGQRAVPLGLPITRFAGAPLGRTVELSIDGLAAFGVSPIAASPVTEEFAPAQFLALTEAEQLSLPSFSRFDAGVEVGAGAVDIGHGARPRVIVSPIVYDTTILDSPTVRRPSGSHVPDLTAVLGLSRSVNGVPPGLGRYRPARGASPLVALDPDRWVVAGTADLGLRGDITSDSSKLGTRVALARFISANPDQDGALQVVLAEEAA